MNLTFEETIENHRKMWNWIADETEKRKIIVSKEIYMKENNIKDIPVLHCYCCEYTIDTRHKTDSCKICPISWGNKHKKSACEDKKSPYYKWVESHCWKSAAKYAREIANLPARRVTWKES